MRFTAVAIVLGVILALLSGGGPSHLDDRPLRAVPALAAGVLLQASAELGDLDGGLALAAVLLSYALLVVFAGLNLRLVGMPIVLVGLVLNVVVIGANGGMPVRSSAIVSSGIAEPQEIAALDFGAKRHLERDDDVLVVLADIVPVRPLREVLSIGDLIAAVGMVVVVFRLLRPRRTRALRP